VSRLIGRVRNKLAREYRKAVRAVRPRRPRSAKPRLGLAGFFGAGNYGDELFHRVFEQRLGPTFELTVLADLPTKPYYSRPVDDIVADVDAVLIGGGDILQPWHADPRYFNRHFLKKPVMAAGIGVPRYSGADARPDSPATIELFRRYVRHEHFLRLAVRDPESRDWVRDTLEPPRDVVLAPDLVCALDLPEAVRPAGAPILGIVTRHRPNRDVPDDYSRLAELARHAQSQGWRVRHIVLGTGIVGQADLANADDLEVPGKELVHSEELDDLSRAIGECTMLASMKFHGTVVATLYGVPSIVLVPTRKNREFMKSVGLSRLVASFTSTELVRIFDERPTVPTEKVAELRAAALRELDEIRSELVAAVGSAHTA